MAIPLIIGAGVAVAGLYKSGKAIVDNSKANDINDDAHEIVEQAQTQLEAKRQQCQIALEQLGQRKLDTLNDNVQNFLQVFNQIKSTEFELQGNADNFNLNEYSKELIYVMQQRVSFAASLGVGLGTGLAGGALTAFGAYSGTMAFAAAGTGTAISSLTGITASNATLAWLGGGSIAAGGMGTAGGMMALGALTAGPALLIAGWYMGAKAETKLNDAHSNLAEARKFQADSNAAIALTHGISEVVYQANSVLSALRGYARRNLKQLQHIIKEQGSDYRQYTPEAKTVMMKNVKIMQLIKVVLDTPILDEQGNLLGDAQSNLQKLHQQIQSTFHNKAV